MPNARDDSTVPGVFCFFRFSARPYPTSKNCQAASVPGPVMDTLAEEDSRNADGSVTSRIVRAV